MPTMRAGWPGSRPRRARYGAKTRYRQADAACAFDADGASGASRCDFDEPQWAVTPGQSAVLYDGEVCLGGGVIDAALELTQRGRARSIVQ